MTSLTFDCKPGADLQHLEKDTYPSHPCWGWFKQHTYDMGSVEPIVSIAGNINTGPSEISQFFTVLVQTSIDGETWQTAGETGAVGSGGYEPFFIDVNTPARYIRFHCPGHGYVDGSNGTIHLQEEQEPVPENGNGKFRINLPVLLLITAAGLGTLIMVHFLMKNSEEIQ